MIMNIACMTNDIERVPRAFGPISRVVENMKQPKRKEDIETRDLSQPHGLLLGCPEAPRAKNMVLPADGCQNSITQLNRDCLTCLHRHKTRPGIVGAAVTEPSNQATEYDRNIGIFWMYFAIEVF